MWTFKFQSDRFFKTEWTVGPKRVKTSTLKKTLCLPAALED